MASGWWTNLTGFAVALVLSAALIRALFPLLGRYALARPNARSSHSTPTPQGGGLAVVAALVIAAVLSLLLANLRIGTLANWSLIGPLVLIAVLGMVDDLRPVPVVPRLLIQTLLVGTTVTLLPERIEIFTALPLWTEKAILIMAGLWFVNLTNFMDGLDWMMVVEIVPLSAALAVLGMLGFLPQTAALFAATLCGALIGFAPFNTPVARLFLGDVGSLPIGLLTGYLLLKLAASGNLAAALLLPMYFVLDASITLLRRLGAREPIWVAHRSHFYQRATDNGFSVAEVVGNVFALNIVLIVLAIASITLANPILDVVFLAAGALATAFLLLRFAKKKNRETGERAMRSASR